MSVGAARRPAVADEQTAFADGRRFLASALEGTGNRPLFVALPAPVAPPEALLALDGAAQLIEPPMGTALAGLGAAHRVALAGPERFAALRAAAMRLFEALVVRAHHVVGDEVPRLLGGLAFAPGAAEEPPWRDFGDGAFTLPRWTYRVERSAGRTVRASLAYAGTPTGGPAAREATVAEYDRLCAHLQQAAFRPRAAGARVIGRISQLDPTAWSRLVEAARAEIAAGRFEKLVCARRATVEAAGGTIDALDVLAGLDGEAAPACTRYAFREGGTVLLGATPERLVARRGTRVRTEALAGSISAAGHPAGRAEDTAGRAMALLGSRKDRAEHRFVVEEIVRRLEPRCRALELPEAPRVRSLRHVLHLHTPIEGELREPAHVLELVEALHPTPAVGGLPAAPAVAWITEHEPAPRGWYAGPIGWFDARGDGEFAVALRGGLLFGAHAWVYAGAGIVAGSDAETEYAETALKQRALLGALGEGKEPSA